MKRSLLMGLCGLLLAVAPASAQDSWFTYLYNWENVQLVQVDASGTQSIYPLGVGQNATFSTRDMAFTRDGQRVALCAQDYSREPTTSTLYVRDIAAQVNVLQIDLGARVGCAVKQAAFSPDESRVAVGLINHFGAIDPGARPDVPAWQLQVYEIASGQVVHELKASDPAVASSGMIPDGVIMPEVRAFSADSIIFAEVPYAVGGPASVSAFAWQYGSGALSPVPDGPYSHFGVDELPGTGETAWAAFNPNLPAAAADSPLGNLNVVVVGTSNGEERIVYHSPEWTIIDVRFIDNGQRLAILLFPPFNPDQQALTRWVAVDRAGNVTELQTNSEVGGSLEAAPDGYIYLQVIVNPENFEATQYALGLFQGSQRRDIWFTVGQTWEVAWSAPTPATPNLPPFTAVR